MNILVNTSGNFYYIFPENNLSQFFRKNNSNTRPSGKITQKLKSKAMYVFNINIKK